MNKLIQFERGYIVAAATIATFFGSMFSNFLTPKLASPTIAFLIVGAVLLVVVALADKLLLSVVERFSIVRKLILGNDFVEGWWYDATLELESETVHHAVLFQIYFEDGGLHISGISFDGENHVRATFKSRFASYEGRMLFAEYEATGDLIDNRVELGVMSLHFAYPPNSYSGFYFDYSGQIAGQVTGKRVSVADLNAYSGLMNIENKQEFIAAKVLSADSSDGRGRLLPNSSSSDVNESDQVS